MYGRKGHSEISSVRIAMISKEPWLAAIFSLLWPGVGHFYGGKKGIGGCIILTSVVLLTGAFYLIWSYEGDTMLGWVLLLILFFLWFISIFHSFHVVRISNTKDFERERRGNKDRYFAVLLSFVAPGAGHLYLKRFVEGIFILALWGGYLLFGRATIPWYVMDLFTALVSYGAYKSTPNRRDGSVSKARYVIILYFFLRVIGQGSYDLITDNYVRIATGIGLSMYPTIQAGDLMLWDMRTGRQIRRGDIVVFEAGPQSDIGLASKRVVAFEGDAIEIKDHSIFINGRRMMEKIFANIMYSTDSSCVHATNGHPYHVPRNSLFVLGDNPVASFDSRHYGAIDINRIRGIEYKIIWPVHRIGELRAQ